MKNQSMFWTSFSKAQIRSALFIGGIALILTALLDREELSNPSLHTIILFIGLLLLSITIFMWYKEYNK